MPRRSCTHPEAVRTHQAFPDAGAVKCPRCGLMVNEDLTTTVEPFTLAGVGQLISTAGTVLLSLAGLVIAVVVAAVVILAVLR